jgi:hypothetical protein
MLKNVLLLTIRVLVAINLLFVAIFYKFAGIPLSVALFTTMSNAVHGIVSQPVFRIGAGVIECVGALLILLPDTARLGAAFVAVYMVGVLLSHVLVLGYGWFFVDAVVVFLLPCVYLLLTGKKIEVGASGGNLI